MFKRLAVVLALSSSLPQNLPPVQGHRCAVFGGAAGDACENHPDWTSGVWVPPPHVTVLRVLVVGGGGGGGSSIEAGIGGAGGGSGAVMTATLPWEGKPVRVFVGKPGAGGTSWGVTGGDGHPSGFDTMLAQGGQGGRRHIGGSALPLQQGGGNGGGGGGGGTYQDGAPGGAGGAGGKGGADGVAGSNGTWPVHGTRGGLGRPLPALDFSEVPVSPGPPGAGGRFGSDRIGFGGGGGGGGGGIMIAGRAGAADHGVGGSTPNQAQGGAPGKGYGAGGGGGGNYFIGTPGGQGASGVVYVEWSQAMIATR